MTNGSFYSIAEHFRNAIDAAVSNGESGMYPFYKFPDDCCDMTCDLLSQNFLEYGIQTVHVNGIHRNDFHWHHVWIQTMDGIIVDITGDQFNTRPNMPNDILAVHVGEEGIIHIIFCKNRQFEALMEFAESIYDSLEIPNKRKQDLLNAYTIIKQYL